MRRVCITGGAGFVGSNVVEYLLAHYPETELLVVDKLTYAGDRANLAGMLDSGRVRLAEVCVTDEARLTALLAQVDVVIHAAAESHVDRSYTQVQTFVDTNVMGTVAVARACIANGCTMLHVSTDEVYGEASHYDFDDNSLLCPTNPYAASKGSAELFLMALQKSYGLDLRVVRPNNMYGPRQHPEKLIPKLILSILFDRPFPLQGTGLARRSFLHTDDFSRALIAILDRGSAYHVYNIPSVEEYSVRDVIEMVCSAMGVNGRAKSGHGAAQNSATSGYGREAARGGGQSAALIR